MRLSKHEKVLRPVHPNRGIEVEYRGKLARIVADMHASYDYFLKVKYRNNPPRMAMDATPAKELERELSTLGRRWQKRIDEAAPRLARWFATKASRRSADSLRKILKDGGFTVDFVMTPGMRDVFEATVSENVALIKSIPEQYHSQIHGAVMRSVAAGRDLADLSKDLRARYGVSRRRADFIARDQNNKTTAVMTRVRQEEVGITKAVWLHSHGGKEPRKTHVKNSGNAYDPKIGWFDSDPKVQRYIWPGELINCRCVSRPVVKGFS